MGAVAEGTVLAGANPLADTLALFLLQALIIIIVARLLAVVLSYLRQPTVIAEVIGGILLGPSALGQITAYREALFPQKSLPLLSLVANVGLILFLFIVGLELDPLELVQNSVQSLTISLAGVIFPFALSILCSKVLYDLIMIPDVEVSKAALPPFSSFLVFTGVAMSITAFPVLARILAERKLLATKVGKVTLTAAAVGDASAWCLLVLVVALISNPSNSIMALYVFLVVVAWGLFLWFAIRPIFKFLIDRTENETISQFAVVFIFLAVLVSSWFTQIIGVHAIFGSFLVGLCVPHTHGFAIKLTEKVEDLVSIVFLPLYFAYSGLNTRIDQLNDGQSWLMVLLVTAVACFGKIVGCGIPGRFTGLNWRESWAVGVLMNTKGLVELIVLNLGLQAGVISARVFTIMVMMALITTFTTVPVISVIYPPKFYKDSRALTVKAKEDEQLTEVPRTDKKDIEIVLCLTGIQCVPSMMALVKMVRESVSHIPPSESEKTPEDSLNNLQISAIRIIPLSERTSAVMKAAEAIQPSTIAEDGILSVFKTFGFLNHLHIITDMIVCLVGSVGESLVEKLGASSSSSDDESGIKLAVVPVVLEKKSSSTHTWQSAFAGNAFNEEVGGLQFVVDKVGCTVCVFLDRGFGKADFDFNALQTSDPNTIKVCNKRTVYVVFNGGADDREALHFVSLITNVITIHILRVRGDFKPSSSFASTTKAGSTSEGTSSVKTEVEILTDDELGKIEDSKDDAALKKLTASNSVTIEELTAPSVFSMLSQASVTSSPSSQTNVAASPELALSNGMNKAMVRLLKQHLQVVNEGDLIVIGRRSYESMGSGSGSFRSWVEGDDCVASACIISCSRN
ncbi:K(+)/H(+) antiporter [Nowakowskiella sp. JEL0407]|nr:K(+)/H(+) antiporter [Nowakowskiella sp. JEL0407]